MKAIRDFIKEWPICCLVAAIILGLATSHTEQYQAIFTIGENIFNAVMAGASEPVEPWHKRALSSITNTIFFWR